MSAYAQDFHLLKLTIALFSTILLIMHMLERWDSVESYAQRLRFMALLFVEVLLVYANYELVRASTPIASRHVMGFLVSVFLLYTVAVSIREYREGVYGNEPRFPALPTLPKEEGSHE